MNYANINSYLTGALLLSAAAVAITSAFAYWLRDHRWWLAACGIALLSGLLLATPALSQLLVVAATAEGIDAVQKTALKAKVTGHLVVFSVLLGSVGANFLTTALTRSR